MNNNIQNRPLEQSSLLTFILGIPTHEVSDQYVQEEKPHPHSLFSSKENCPERIIKGSRDLNVLLASTCKPALQKNCTLTFYMLSLAKVHSHMSLWWFIQNFIDLFCKYSYHHVHYNWYVNSINDCNFYWLFSVAPSANSIKIWHEQIWRQSF